MAPFLVLVGLFAAFSAVDLLPVGIRLGWWTALRFALAGMFLLTASAHWGKRRPDLIRMVPPGFPHPEFLVTFTGILEVAGAAGLLVERLAGYAAAGLCLLLIAVFPANVHAARHRLTIGGRHVPGVVSRAVLQGLFIAATIAVFAAASE